MYLVYDDKPKGKFTGSILEMDANKNYMVHYKNFLYLSFMYKNGSTLEKIQSSKEIDIAKRKMKFWKSHPNYNEKFIMKERENENKNWSV